MTSRRPLPRVSHGTITTHVRAICGKLALGSRRDAADVARRHGLLSSETR